MESAEGSMRKIEELAAEGVGMVSEMQLQMRNTEPVGNENASQLYYPVMYFVDKKFVDSPRHVVVRLPTNRSSETLTLVRLHATKRFKNVLDSVSSLPMAVACVSCSPSSQLRRTTQSAKASHHRFWIRRRCSVWRSFQSSKAPH